MSWVVLYRQHAMCGYLKASATGCPFNVTSSSWALRFGRFSWVADAAEHPRTLAAGVIARPALLESHPQPITCPDP
jgi:hypothetical protein